jgi:murein DD-endopeptidase MepM/ murein hydrolase activator NlpD
MRAQHDVATDHLEVPVAGSHRRRRRAGHRRRPTLLLAALVAGGVAAGVFGFDGSPSASAESTSVAAQALATTDDDAVEGMPQASITVAEAQERLQEVAASRAQRAAAEEQAREAARPKAVLPVNGARLTTCFCMRWGAMHYGIDLAAPMYTPEYAAEDGVVLRAGSATGFGLAVYILHADGYVTVYGHMDSIKVRVGQYVQAGQTIALLGMRGESTGPHLHFEIHKGGEYGTPIDPIPWLRARGISV